MIASILIVAGIAVGCFGVWLWGKSMDPLGYVPNFVGVPLLLGMILLAAGIIMRIAQ